MKIERSGNGNQNHPINPLPIYSNETLDLNRHPPNFQRRRHSLTHLLPRFPPLTNQRASSRFTRAARLPGRVQPAGTRVQRPNAQPRCSPRLPTNPQQSVLPEPPSLQQAAGDRSTTRPAPSNPLLPLPSLPFSPPHLVFSLFSPGQRTPWTLRPRAAAPTSSRAAYPVTPRRLRTTPQLAGEPRWRGPCHRREPVSRGWIRRCLAPPAPVAASSPLLRLLPPVRHQGAATMAPEA